VQLLIGLMVCAGIAGGLSRTRRVRYVVAQVRLLRRSMRREFRKLDAGHTVELLMEQRAKKVTLEG
jgi:hypothetical protein